MNINRYILTTLLVVSGAVFLGNTFANAYTYPNVGDTITLGAGPGGGVNGGGEFYWDINKGNNAFKMDFISFCLEDNEFIDWGRSYVVGDISYGAKNGGVGGQIPNTNYDPLDQRTAYLYTMFTNNTLANFDFVDPAKSAPALQLAIWYIENEITSLTVFGDNQYSSLAQTFLDEAKAAEDNGTWKGLGNVRVINLLTLDGHNAQDQLTMAPVPEPATMLLFGAGLAGLAGLRTRRKQ